jgi:hypothetical protein
MALDINLPLPTYSEKGDEAWILSAEQANLLARKVNAILQMRAELPVKITKSDTGFLFSAAEGWATPAGAVPQWVETSICIDGDVRTLWVFGALVPV